MFYKLSLLAIVTGLVLYLSTFAQLDLNQSDQAEITVQEKNNDFVLDDTSSVLADSSTDSTYKPEIDNPHYSKCTATCEKIWQKWPNVTNKELCQQECLMKVIDSELTQSSPEGKKEDKKENKKEDKKKDKKKRD